MNARFFCINARAVTEQNRGRWSPTTIIDHPSNRSQMKVKTKLVEDILPEPRGNQACLPLWYGLHHNEWCGKYKYKSPLEDRQFAICQSSGRSDVPWGSPRSGTDRCSTMTVLDRSQD